LFRKTPLKAQKVFSKNLGMAMAPLAPLGYAYEEHANFWGCEGFLPKFP